MNAYELLKCPESKTLEFKRDLSSPDGVLRTIIAFANTSGGSLIIGVEEDNKHVCGVTEPLNVEERLANIINDRIVPKLIPNIEILPWRKTYLLVVEVYPSYNRPHYLKNMSIEKGTYVRIGSSNRLADPSLIQELQRYSKAESFDEQPCPELSSEAIDFKVVSEFFAEHRKLKVSDLETLKLITKYNGRKVPTVGGMILFGKDRNHYFPDAWIQAGCFNGTNRTHIIDSRKIYDYPILAIEEAIRFIQKNSKKSAHIGPVRRIDTWSLPPVAVREAIINAVVHADYSQKGAPIRLSIFSDRLEVESPGLIPFNLTIDDIHRGISKLRNPVIGRIFHEVQLIEHWGSGIRRMMEACQDAGLSPPMIEEVGPHFRVTIFTERTSSQKLNEIDTAIIEALKAHNGISTQEVADKIKKSTRTARTHLLHLIGLGMIIEIGSSPQDPGKKYFLRRKE